MIKGLTNIELTPEFVAKLGCAYGTSLPKGSIVLSGRDAALSSRMLKRSFLGGILSAGVNVRDLKMVPLPVLSYKLKTFGEVGGAHFRQAVDDPASTEIVFLDADGIDFSSSMGKNVERIFYKENFRRAHHKEPGGISELPQVFDFYREGFTRSINQEMLKTKNFKVVVDFCNSPAGQVLPAILNDMGCEVIGLNAYIDEQHGPSKAQDKSHSLSQLAKIVATLEAQAGFWLDPTVEEVVLIDETGKLYEGAELLTLIVKLLLKVGREGSPRSSCFRPLGDRADGPRKWLFRPANQKLGAGDDRGGAVSRSHNGRFHGRADSLSRSFRRLSTACLPSPRPLSCWLPSASPVRGFSRKSPGVPFFRPECPACWK